MEPEKDIFEQWFEEKESQPWVRKKLRFLQSWWRFDGRYYHTDLIKGIKKLWYWFPVIWKDRDWDSNYIYYILEHKIKAQSKYIRERDIHTTAKRDAEIMMICVRLMEKDREEFYTMEYIDYHKSKHWFEPVPGNENLSSWNSRLLEENFDEYFRKYPLIYKKVLNGEGPFTLEGREKDKEIIAMNIAHINQKRAHKLLFKILEENIQKWWD
jgi:hypothetical protein